MDSAPRPDAAGSTLDARPTVLRRPFIAPGLWAGPTVELGYPPDHPYVRRFWTAVIGPGAVADLLRLAAAARRGDQLKRPLHLSVLAQEGLIIAHGGQVLVRPTIPPLAAEHTRRLPPLLRREHRNLRFDTPHHPN